MENDHSTEGSLKLPLQNGCEPPIHHNNGHLAMQNKELVTLSSSEQVSDQQKEISSSNHEQVETSSQNYKYSVDEVKETSAIENIDREDLSNFSKGSKDSKTEMWPANTVGALISKFEETHHLLNGGNFSKKNWESLAAAVNRSCNTDFTGLQCKYKWNSLMKTYKKEKRNLAATANKTSFWPYYKDIDRIVGKSRKCAPLATAFTGMEWRDENDAASKRKRKVIESVEEHASKQIEQLQNSQANAGVVEGKYVKSAKYALDSVTETMRENTQKFLETMKEIEYKRMEHEGKLMDKMLEMQFQIAKLFAQK